MKFINMSKKSARETRMKNEKRYKLLKESGKIDCSSVVLYVFFFKI